MTWDCVNGSDPGMGTVQMDKVPNNNEKAKSRLAEFYFIGHDHPGGQHYPGGVSGEWR